MRYKGKCYQEFTPAFCPEGQILNLGTIRLPAGEKYQCVDNPCAKVQPGSIPSR